jgi:RND family efflux transporter MFP subunit
MCKIHHLDLVPKALYGTLLILLFSATAFGDTIANQKPHIKVTVKPLSELLISSKSSVPASIISLNHAVLGAQISGKVNKVKVKTGDIVSKNTLLLEMDCRDYVLAKKQAQAGLESAKAQQALANKQYTRNLQLRKLKTIPQNLLDESILQTQVVRADIAVKKAALKQSELAIERCKIRAPFTGQITERLVSVGQLLAPNSPVFKLLQTQALEVSAALTSSDVVNAKGASGLFFTRGSLRTPVTFRSVVNEVNEGSRTQQALLVPENSKGLVVGYSGRLEWIGRRSMLPA